MTHVHVVEDDVPIAEWLSITLPFHGPYKVTLTTYDFDRLFEVEAWDGVDVAIVDLMLPGTSGTDLLAWLAEHLPGIRRIAFSASRLSLLDLPDGSAHVRLLKGDVGTAGVVEAIKGG